MYEHHHHSHNSVILGPLLDLSSIDYRSNKPITLQAVSGQSTTTLMINDDYLLLVRSLSLLQTHSNLADKL